MPPPNGRDPLPGVGGPTTATPITSRPAASTAPTTAPASASASAIQSSGIRRNDESWVEIASQPSSSSLSSIADEIVITGLRVGSHASGPNGGSMPQRRRRLLQQVEAAAGAPTATSQPTSIAPQFAHSPAGSSQEEYDETESEEDRLMSSSAESVRPPRSPNPFSLLQQQAQAQRAAISDGDDEDDDDDDGTALGMPASGPPTFHPQPNAFSHPPTHLQQHRSMPTPSHQHIAPPYGRSASQRSQPRQPRSSGPPHFMPPSYREDNDEALRASLTTLLSCAAAARGLPKKETEQYGGPAGIASGLRPSDQPMNLRLAPESELMAETPVLGAMRGRFQPLQMPPQPQNPQSSPVSRPNSTYNQPAAGTQQPSRGNAASAVSASSKSKRTAAATAGTSSKSPRATKKKRTASTAVDGEAATTYITPTLLTWVVSAGVVVLVSVVGFGAGFVIGREVGRQEAASAAIPAGSLGSSGAANATSSCGREIMRSSTGSTLRRFRWGAGMTKSVAA